MKFCAAVLLFIILMAPYCPAAAKQVPDREESLSVTGEIPPARIKRLPWGRDLFVPVIKGTKAPAMRLKAIFYNDKNPSAIIDDIIVYRGSTIKGYRVVEITETGVVLRGRAGPLRLEITSLPEVGARNGSQ